MNTYFFFYQQQSEKFYSKEAKTNNKDHTKELKPNKKENYKENSIRGLLHHPHHLMLLFNLPLEFNQKKEMFWIQLTQAFEDLTPEGKAIEFLSFQTTQERAKIVVLKASKTFPL